MPGSGPDFGQGSVQVLTEFSLIPLCTVRYSPGLSATPWPLGPVFFAAQVPGAERQERCGEGGLPRERMRNHAEGSRCPAGPEALVGRHLPWFSIVVRRPTLAVARILNAIPSLAEVSTGEGPWIAMPGICSRPSPVLDLSSKRFLIGAAALPGGQGSRWCDTRPGWGGRRRSGPKQNGRSVARPPVLQAGSKPRPGFSCGHDRTSHPE